MKKTLFCFICAVGALFFSCTPASVVVEDERNDNNADPTSGTYIPKGALTHLFSVSPTKKVFFAKGNLQYNLSDKTFRFADYQYDMKQSAVNLSGENSVLEYFPYGASGAGYTRPDKQESLPQKDISETSYDWGQFCPISNAENIAGFWRTLTLKEWEYLLHKRTNADSLNCIVTYNGITGLLLLPDDYNGSLFAHLTFTDKTGDNYYYNDNYPRKKEYVENKLEQSPFRALESAGAVFLPFGPQRKTQDGEYNEHYWTSTYYSGNQARTVNMHTTHLNEAALDITSTAGLARVRLVQDYPIERYAMTYSSYPTTNFHILFKDAKTSAYIGDKLYFAVYDKEQRRILNAGETLNAIGGNAAANSAKWTITKTDGEELLRVTEDNGLTYDNYLLGFAVAEFAGSNAKYRITYSVNDESGKTIKKIENYITVTVYFPEIN